MKTYSQNEWQKVAGLLKDGKIAAFPTDTVFGLGTLYGSLDRLAAIKHVKHRPETKPIPFMVASLDQLEEVAELNEAARKLADKFLPGALTLVLKRKDSVPDAYTNGLETIAVRIPDAHPLLELLESMPAPLLVTSANESGEPAAIKADQIHLDGVAALLDGEVKEGLASTIVDCTQNPVAILRKGPISEAEIRTVLSA